MIVDSAIELFNRNGFHQVTMRDLASHMDISPGNLTYHFKKKEQILKAIYKRMLQDIETHFDYGPLSLDELNANFYQIAVFQIRYEFYFKDIINMITLFPHLNVIHEKVVVERIEHLTWQLRLYERKGLMKKESMPGEYEMIAQQVWLVISNWLPYQALMAKSKYSFDTHRVVKMVWNVIAPHFNRKGKEAFETIVAERNK